MVRYTGEYFIDVKGVARASMFPLQSSSVYRSEFYAPKANRFSADRDAPFGEQILNVAVT